MVDLPFHIETCLADRRGCVQYFAVRGGKKIGIGKYVPGDIDRRSRLAREWARNPDLHNGKPLAPEEVSLALDRAEAAAWSSIEAQLEDQAENTAGDAQIEAAALVNVATLAELAWNTETGHADFVIYNRVAQDVTRGDTVPTLTGKIGPPRCCAGLVTPGWPFDGAVFLPTDYDEIGLDEEQLRADIESFIRTFVELTDAATKMCVEYVLLTWIHDSFDELPYLAFRTADAGRGKSRALSTVGALCYRGILCGGGSTAAATLRLLDRFGGTLLADEFDQRDSELAAELTRILNQGFEKNRPLVRCDGETNDPKPFRCFGPKIFALRKGFADDATETRIISIYMRQRTRDDIPLSLPRREFDRRALVLRNRLLAWRFANLGRIAVDALHADPRLEDRHNQIGLPLMAVARTEEGRDRIVAALLEQQDEIAGDRADSLPGEVFEAAMEIAQIGDTVRPGDVAAEVIRRRAAAQGIDIERLPKTDRISAHKVGWIIKKVFELPRERVRQGTVYRLEAVRVAQLRKRFAASSDDAEPLSKSMPSSPHCHSDQLQPSETPLLDGENADCGNVAVAAISAEVEAGDDASCNHPPQIGPSASVPNGWTSESWSIELERKADACAKDHPKTADEYRREGMTIRQSLRSRPVS